MKIKNELRGLPEDAFSLNFESTGEIAHFYHANGFPLGIYEPLLSRLGQKLSISALAMRATWPNIGPPPRKRTWDIYAHDLIAYIEATFERPIIAIGHSMGATCTAMAASTRPDLFKAVVLIEVAMLSRPLAKLASIAPKVVMELIEPAKSTLKKKDSWRSRSEFEESCKNNPVFKRFNKEAFEALVKHGLSETPGGDFKYAFPKSWEAHNYTQPPNIMSILENLNVPCVAIRGKPSVFFSDAMWQEWKSCNKRTIFLENTRQGHLFPIENPQSCSELIHKGLAVLK
jgi:pimeloyl-ACP methyl ester carboxylesterase